MRSCTTPVLREQLGDYGCFDNSDDFHREGNILDDFNPRSLNAYIGPEQHRVDELQGYNRDSDIVKIHCCRPLSLCSGATLHKPISLSLPSNDHINSTLVFLSARSINRYLVTRIIQCDQFTEHRRGLFGEPTCTEVFHIV